MMGPIVHLGAMLSPRSYKPAASPIFGPRSPQFEPTDVSVARPGGAAISSII